MPGQRQKYNLDELRLWMATCGCPKPAIHWSSDFNARMCQNCGVLLTAEDMNVQESQSDQTFVHLRVHTHHSLLRATCKPEDLIKKAKEYGMPALAKTEFGNMCGAPSFVRDCQKADIKPILGVEFNVRFGQTTYPITFIALDREGYKQLVKMTTTAWCERKNKNLGVHILDSDIPNTIHLIALVDVGIDFNLANQALHVLKNEMETYLEVNTTNQQVVTFAAQTSQQAQLPVVVTGNVLYTEETDKVSYGVALKIGKHAIDYGLPEHIDNWFKPPVFYGTFFEHAQPWVENAISIADRVEDYGLVNKEFIVPTFKDGVKEYTDLDEVHRKLEVEAWRGLYEKGKSSNQVYIERMQYELNVMKEKDFSSYFLLIGEIVNWMEKQGIMVPFGRGSSVGSLVCYALNIITMDPIRWGVPFERFINSGRTDLPDIDTDISQERRPEVLSHIAEVHGKDRVAHIATYQTMALRAAIENSGRALQVPHVLNRDIRKTIPDDVSDWDGLDEGGKAEVRRTMEFNPEWLTIAQALTGTAKNLGFHAAGVVISNEPLGELVPLIPPPEEDGLFGIQYDMHDCEILGLLKLDMLGLRNIDIIQYTLDRVKVRHGIDLNVYDLPSDDPSTYELISSADYVSIFQLDSTGYRRLCRQLQPRQFEHIMALNALFRPGPLEGGMTDEFVERRHGRRELVGWHPWLDEVLSITYQVPVFQEQVMAIAKIIAGFNDVEADKYRKAIGKKDAVKFAAAQEQFKESALKRPGLTPPISFDGTLEQWINELLEKLAGYARYGWNIGHSCGYGWITYITAYLETHFPQEYYASLLDAFRGNNKKLPSLLRSILGSGKCIIVPPNVNESFIDYEVGTDGNIYMGLAAVRNVGKAAPEIVKERERSKFSSFINFCQRLPGVNKTAKVNLVKSGAFGWDKMLCDRDKVDNIDIIQKWAKKRTKKFDGSRASPLEIAMKLEGVGGYDYTELERTQNERDVLNSFITGHPAAIYHKLSPYLERGNTRVLTPSGVNIEECQIGDAILVVGMIDYLRKKQTREDPTGRRPSRPYLNLNISDNTGSLITNIWWPLCEDLQKILVAGEIAMFECIVKPDKYRDDAIMLKVDNAINLSNGLPIQGVFRKNGYDPGEVVTKIGGIVNNISILGPRQYASIRGRITVPPHLLDEAVKELGEDISYLVSMEAIDYE